SLIHDVGHSSWGHGLEPMCSLLPFAQHDFRFDKIRLFQYLQDDLNPLSMAIDQIPNVDRKRLLEFFRDPQNLKDKFVFLNDLIDSEADLDRIDYLNRDAYHTYGPVGTIDEKSLIKNITFVPTKIGTVGKTGYKMAYLPEAAQVVHILLETRDAMYSRVYESDSKIIFEEMLCHAVFAFYKGYALDEHDLEQILRLTDGDLVVLIHLFGRDYEKEMVRTILCGETDFLVQSYKISLEPNNDAFEKKVFLLASQLKVTGFEEKV
ncbi:unnamed protein product, partial [marine sediment metagenome]